MNSIIQPPAIADRIWGAELADNPRAWRHPLPDGLISTLLARVANSSSADQPVTTLRLTDADRTAWGQHFVPALRDLETGRGFVIFDSLPVEDLSLRQSTALYWLIGQFLGEPLEQNVEGWLLYHVRDMGRDVASGARFSVTNYESSFHTDNSFGETILDYVGLLCLKTAKQGGVSQNVSGHAVYDVLRRQHADVLQTLSQPYHVDRRGGFREGESPTVRRPVISWNESELLIRYLRYWIEVGHDKAGEPLTDAQRLALDVLDEVLKRPELRVEFSLRPGEMYFINNRWILHNRTAFTDHADPEQRRHLVRLWLRVAGS